jgi:hypothetical protein
MKLAESYHWTSIRAASRVSTEGRDRQIIAAHRDEMPVSDIASAARISPARVRQIINKEAAR